LRQRVLVLGDDAKAFLAVVRSLGRRGIEVHSAPPDPAAPALKSRYIARTHRLPLYGSGADAWAAALRILADRESIGWIVPTSDAGLLRLIRHADSLGRERLALPGERAEALLTDKAATRRLAFECGVPVCRGRPVAAGDDAAILADAFGLPLVLKPRRSWSLDGDQAKISARIVRSLEALEAALAPGLAGEWLAEAFFPGAGVGVSVLARDGDILGAIQHRRLEQEHETGPSTRRVTEPLDPRLLAWVRDLAAAAGLDGVGMFEFKRSPAGEHVLLEVNPRFWGSLPLALEAGADFPALLHAVRFASAPAPSFGYAIGCSKTDLIGEYCRVSNRFAAARSFGGRIAALLAMVAESPRLLAPRLFDSFADDDPAPFHEERRQLLGWIAAGIVKRLPLRRSGRPAARPVRESGG
jgi:predicted ATP-grasp superfamily ATP-dependent carboligase